MPAKRLVVIGASSGGIEALQTITARLPPDFPAAICVVVHTAPSSPGMLDAILNRESALPAVNAASGMRLEEGHIYVAPPDYHLLVEPGTVRITKGPRENRMRPAIDPLFRSAAQVFGPAAIGVILTGGLDDGTAGLGVIKRLGGVAIVQDPSDALFPSMPRSAVRHVDVDYTVGLKEIGPLLARLVTLPPEEREAVATPEPLEIEVNIANEHNAIDAGVERLGEPSAFACPECHGVLLRMKDARPLRFRCHTGHAYSVESLVAAASDGIEEALWTAVRALDEAALLMEHLAAHARADGDREVSESLSASALAAHRGAEAVRQIATTREELTAPKA